MGRPRGFVSTTRFDDDIEWPKLLAAAVIHQALADGARWFFASGSCDVWALIAGLDTEYVRGLALERLVSGSRPEIVF